jgi:pimeloyl-ACP methyl ester carboxylesterase/DNA-binding CsgD family transcriptional regulator
MYASMKQRICLRSTTDGVTLAWAEAGHGAPLVKASNWLTHLEYDWESPVWRHWTRFFARNFHYFRYDERGCGMTDWQVGDLSFPRWVEDLEAVVAAARLDRPFALLGISQGAATAVAYAVEHPERVSHLILYGGYALGAKKRGDSESAEFYELMQEAARLGWGRDNPAFRQLFTARFIPDGTDEQICWFNDLCSKTTLPEIGAKLIALRAEVDICHLLSRVQVPTLVLHGGNDEVVPLSEGKRLARGIPDATFVQLDSRNHILLEHEAAWCRFQQAVLEFTGQSGLPSGREEATLESLTRREREALALLCDGCSNAQIAWQLQIAEKTARNHISRVYCKLGVHSRAEAIVFAHRHGLHGRSGHMSLH